MHEAESFRYPQFLSKLRDVMHQPFITVLTTELVHVLSQINLVPSLVSYFFKMS